MNIFVLHLDPYKCAQMHCDKHVVKMIIESAQLLYSCCLLCGIIGHDINELISSAPLTLNGEHGYRKTHVNHPCSVWLRESVKNYEWLLNMAKALCKEYTIRYKKIHATEKHINWLSYVCPCIPNVSMTPFAIVMPDTYKYIIETSDSKQICYDPIKSYRTYYNEEKKFAKWSVRDMPKWYEK